jgi:methyl-accepting chemotaxis protein
MNTNHLADAPIVTAKDAIARHMQWKITLQLAIALNEPLSPSAIHAIEHSEECPGGRWIVSQHASSLRNTPEFRDLVVRHEEFHRELARIASMINNGKYAAARRALDPNSNFRKVSQAMSNAITALDRIQTIAIAS